LQPDLGGFIRPASHLSLFLNYLVADSRAAGWYWASIGILGVVGVLAFLLFARLTGRWTLGFAAAVFFIVWAPHAQTTAQVAARTDSVQTLFLLAGLLAYVEWRRSRRLWLYASILVAFALAMMSKETGIMCLPLLVLVEWVLSREGRPGFRWFVPLLVLWFADIGLTLAFLNRIGFWHKGGVGGAPALSRLATWIGGLAQVTYPSTQVGAWSAALALTAVILVGAGLLAGRWSRFGLAWALLSLLPNLAIRAEGPFLRSVGLFAASLGMCWAAAAILFALRDRWPRATGPAIVLGLALVVVQWKALYPGLVQWRAVSFDVREAAQTAPRAGPADVLALVNLPFSYNFVQYLYGEPVPRFQVFTAPGVRPQIMVGPDAVTLYRRLQEQATGPVRPHEHYP
jgi:hypothetical protein